MVMIYFTSLRSFAPIDGTTATESVDRASQDRLAHDWQ
jgi:hypothetical protein